MHNLTRNIILAVLAVIAIVLFLIFLSIVLRIALVVALFALAYYWFTRATANRRRRNWR